MMADKWTDQNVGGGPMKGMPMRAETFHYEENKDISDTDRIIAQGLINPNTKTLCTLE